MPTPIPQHYRVYTNDVGAPIEDGHDYSHQGRYNVALNKVASRMTPCTPCQQSCSFMIAVAGAGAVQHAAVIAVVLLKINWCAAPQGQGLGADR